MLEFFIPSSIIIAILLDLIFGELPTKIHPVVIIGHIISFLKSKLIKYNNKWTGLILTLSTCFITSLIILLILFIISFNYYLFIIVFSVILSSTFSINMLLRTAIDIKKDLDMNIDKARESLSYLVSRNTGELTEEFIVSATIETLTENITDSYIAPMFYYLIFALLIPNDYIVYLILVPLIYRISNTLDAMLGYKTDELINIGFIPAKLDDILNYIPSRLSGFYVVISSFLLKYDYKNAYKIMKRDARACPSPNSGYTMATTSGALNVQLVKKDTYILGDKNKEISKDDISKAVKLSSLTIALFSLTILVLCVIL